MTRLSHARTRVSSSRIYSYVPMGSYVYLVCTCVRESAFYRGSRFRKALHIRLSCASPVFCDLDFILPRSSLCNSDLADFYRKKNFNRINKGAIVNTAIRELFSRCVIRYRFEFEAYRQCPALYASLLYRNCEEN